ncbi:MAG TPA: PAS domain-containing protein, partial [Syntrophobacteraceae bacterium]|nr:PAS domain-containing protein [Syntrophobacteraceae bacterium]
MADMHETICRCLSEQANQGIFATDGGLTITSWNRWLELHSGRTTSQMVGCGLLEAYPDLVDRGLDRVYQEALSGRSVMLSQRFHRYLLPMPSAVHDMETASAPHMLQSARISPLTENGRVVGTLT